MQSRRGQQHAARKTLPIYKRKRKRRLARARGHFSLLSPVRTLRICSVRAIDSATCYPSYICSGSLKREGEPDTLALDGLRWSVTLVARLMRKRPTRVSNRTHRCSPSWPHETFVPFTIDPSIHSDMRVLLKSKFVSFSFQMNRPIQVKPADSDNRGGECRSIRLTDGANTPPD